MTLSSSRARLLGATVAALLVARAAVAQTLNLVVPNSHALVEGDANNAVPFNYLKSLHYQQIYDASQFSVLRPNGGTISYIGFRHHQGNNQVSVRYQITVRLSTTSRAVDALSTDLTSNLGPDSQIVYSSTSYRISPASDPGKPWPFPIVIPFTSGFFYNPINGNLLVDMTVWQYYTSYAGPLLDVVTGPGDSVSRVFRDAQGYYGSTPDTIGAATEFGLIPVAALQPRITTARVTDNNFIADGTGGAPGLVYCVLSVTNISDPITNWLCIGTNTFDSAGDFTFTNTLGQTATQQFYRIQIQ